MNLDRGGVRMKDTVESIMDELTDIAVKLNKVRMKILKLESALSENEEAPKIDIEDSLEDELEELLKSLDCDFKKITIIKKGDD